MDISQMKQNIEDNVVVLQKELKEMQSDIEDLQDKRSRLSHITSILQGNVMRLEDKLEETY